MFQTTAVKTNGDDTATETLIGSLVRISGTLTSDGDVRINGTLEKGEVAAKGVIVVGPSGSVTANIAARAVRVEGRVEGNIIASDGVEIATGGSVRGEVSCGGKLTIETGGSFIGTSVGDGKQNADVALEAELKKDLARKS